MTKATSPVPEGFHTVTPQLVLEDAAGAIEWYKKALGAREVSRAPGPDGKIMHAEIAIGDSRIMLNDAMMGAKGPKALGGSPISLWVYVPDADALFNRAIAAGAQAVRRSDGHDAGPVLGRPVRLVDGPARVPVDDCHPQGGSHARGTAAAHGSVDEELRRAGKRAGALKAEH